MITKDEFNKFLTEYEFFEEATRRMKEAFCGKSHLFVECDWVDSVGKMLDIFIESHFTEKGADWVYYYLFENIDDKKVVIEVKDMFGIEEKEYHLNSIDELWEFLLTDKKLYFKNAE
jgi:hypothetical protein